MGRDTFWGGILIDQKTMKLPEECNFKEIQLQGEIFVKFDINSEIQMQSDSTLQ